MTRPAFGIGRGGQITIDQLFGSVGRRVAQESTDFCGGGGQAGKVERHPADVSAFIGIWGEGEIFGPHGVD